MGYCHTVSPQNQVLSLPCFQSPTFQHYVWKVFNGSRGSRRSSHKRGMSHPSMSNNVSYDGLPYISSTFLPCVDSGAT